MEILTRISEISDIHIRLNINMVVFEFNIDFYCFSLSDSTSVFDNIEHYPYPFPIKLFKKLYLFSITNIINFCNKDIRRFCFIYL
jgi:hypothetical protein